MPSTSLWTDTAPLPEFPQLSRNLSVDAVVIGAGNTGVSAAYLLKRAGQTVALIERDRCGGVDTAHTSAHLTYVTDLRFKQLTKKVGRDHAQAVLDAGEAAIQQIESNIAAEKIDCDFARVPGYLTASLVEKRDETETLREEAKLANEMGFHATYVDETPFFRRPGIRFPNQARFHPLKYLNGLLRRIPGKGSHVFEHTEAVEFSDDGLEIKANGHTLKCKFIVIATDVPLMGKTNMASAALLQTKISPYTSYVIGAKLPKGTTPDALFWDTSDPYFFFRIEPHETHDYAIFGGEDHKTGQEKHPSKRFAALEEMLHRLVPKAKVDRRWSGQVIEAVDGLPYIGETAERQFVATGFSGNGLTFGTLSAMMARDAALGRKNPWQELFRIRRKKLGSTWNYLRENADYPYYMIKDRVISSEGKSLRSVKRDQGKILKIDGQRLAVYRDRGGKVTKLNPVCTHLGCLVRWNEAERTWDCPCHGSRFCPTGEVLAGPAETPLPPAED